LAPALNEIRELSELSQGRYPIAWKREVSATLIPHVSQVRTVVDMLRLQGALQAHDRDIVGATRTCRTMLNAARSLGDEPFLVSMLVRDACSLESAVAAERLLAQGQCNEKLLAEIQEKFAAEIKQAQQRFLAGMRSERAAWHQVGNVIQSGDELEWREWRDIRSDEFKFWLYMNINVRYGQALHLRLMNEAVEIAKLPLHEQRTDLKEFEDRVRAIKKGPQTALALLMMPAVVKVYNAHCKAEAILNCASVSL